MAIKLQISSDHIQLLYNGHFVPETDLLSTWNSQNELEFGFDMSIQYKPAIATSGNSAQSGYQIPERIQVHVVKEDGSAHVVVVEIQKAADLRKPYLGGYRHKKTGVTYHHATIQTLPTGPPKLPSIKYERDTQTNSLQTRSVQTKREFGTQMVCVLQFKASSIAA